MNKRNLICKINLKTHYKEKNYNNITQIKKKN